MNRVNGRSPLIFLNGVSKHFWVGDQKLTILKEINFTVHSGEFVAIVGPSGNGKSTLLNMIAGIDRPSQGEVVVAGQPIHILSENELAKWRGNQVGIVFQFFQMLPALSLRHNVLLPMDFAGKYDPSERLNRASNLLAMVGLADQEDKLPGMVSGGQEQRAAIARALANDPPLILADEPTGNLDSQAAEQVFGLFHQLAQQGKTVLMVTHDWDLARRVPRLIEIRDGRIVNNESGNWKQEMAAPSSELSAQVYVPQGV